MCGIAGIFSAHGDEPVAAHFLDRLVDALAHRGPDGRGICLDGPVGLGARRLSVIDEAGGSQPMTTPDGVATLVYNGEIYNHAELRRALVARGHAFRTRSDTEVVLLGYREWGARGLAERLNGIFAFAVWDRQRRTGVLCRDRLGVKPLYYADRNGRTVFASELRALAASGLLRPKIDDEALQGFLTYQFTPDSRTLLAGVSKLPPGHLLTWREGQSRLDRYWDFPGAGEQADGDLAAQARELKALLWDTIERQTMSDGPIGCFLSGGLDSTVVATIMARLSEHPVRTYSVAFPDHPPCDESAHFEDIARLLGTRHTTVPFTHRDIADRLPEIAWAADEPVGDPALLPTYVLSAVAAQDVKVVLTGEGADEVFAGYPYYRAFAGPFQPQPERNDRAAWRRATMELFARTGHLVPAPRVDTASAHSGFPYAMDATFLWHLLAPERRPDTWELADIAERTEARALAGRGGASRLHAALLLDSRLWLANDLMGKLDKMTMAHSLEGRVPFLDHRVVEFACRLPDSARIGAEHGKIVLREAVRGLVPERHAWRRKQGFNVPLDVWFRGPLRGFVRETLLGSDLESLGLFDRRAVEALLVGHLELGWNVARPVWQLLCLVLWFRQLRTTMSEHDPAVRPLELGAQSPRGDYASPHDCDIVVPVYEGLHFVRDLLRSIERWTTPGSYRLILVDDSANPTTHTALVALGEGRPWLQVVCNETNQGFVASCNRGIALGDAPFVCLLNSDTLVSQGWLQRLLATARSDDTIAVVNPMSNQAVNLSLPFPPGYDLDRLSRRLVELGRGRVADVTTAVGFCMLVRRSTIDLLGAFDPVFGHGYCEESDLCMRFTEAGFRVVAALDAFVYHRGCGSFGTWVERYRANRPIFDARWAQEYQRDYQRFLERRPLGKLRDALLRHTETANTATDASLGGDPLGRSPARNGRPHRPADAEARETCYPTAEYLVRIPSGSGLRITFLVESMQHSGGMTSIVQLAREFVLAGHSVNLVTLQAELHPERFNLPLQPLVFANRKSLLRLFPPSDVVIATYWSTAHAWLPALRRRHDFLSLYFIQDYEAFFYPESDSTTRRDVFASYAGAEHRIVKSRWLAALLRDRHGLDSEIVPLGLDLGIFRAHDARRPEARPRVLSVARPHERRRGFAELAAAFRRVHAERPDAELVLFGCSDAELPSDLGFPYVNAGPLPDPVQVASLLRSCDVLVDSSLYQAFGRPGLEAMACGLGAVLTSEGGVVEYARHEKNCLLVAPGDGPAIADAILHLLGDAELRDRLRDGGIATAARFCHLAEARRHLELYTTWLASRGERRGPRSIVA